MADSTEQAPTVIGAAENETDIMGPVEYPETPTAWSSDEWDTTPYRRRRGHWGLYALPVGVLAVVLTFAVMLVAGGHRQAEVAHPAPAPPTAVIPSWTPDFGSDARYIRAMKDAGWDIKNQQIDLNHAHWSCTYLGQGHTMKELVEYWDQQPYEGETPVQNHDDDVQWTGIIVTNMCPRFR